MKTPYLVVFMCLASCLVAAEPPSRWLLEYFTIERAFDQERDDYLLSKHPEWKDRLQMLGEVTRADEDLKAYLFVYHLQHDPQTLTWDNGDWELCVTVCNCGKEGSVPTAEFRKLFEVRCAAMQRLEEKYGIRVYEEIGAETRHIPKYARGVPYDRVAHLRARFEAIVNSPNQQPLQTPTSGTPAAGAPGVPPSSAGGR